MNDTELLDNIDRILDLKMPELKPLKLKNELYSYEFMLNRLYAEVDKYKQIKHILIPVPKLVKVNIKKVVIINIIEISQSINRDIDHIINYLSNELSSNVNLDGKMQMIIDMRINNNDFENVLKKYIITYVLCNQCKGLHTEYINKYINCLNCKSSRYID